MTIFVIWPKIIDTEFRLAYFSEVVETIQITPLMSETHYLVGSSMLTEQHKTNLQIEFTDVVFSLEAPEGFTQQV